MNELTHKISWKWIINLTKVTVLMPAFGILVTSCEQQLCWESFCKECISDEPVLQTSFCNYAVFSFDFFIWPINEVPVLNLFLNAPTTSCVSIQPIYYYSVIGSTSLFVKWDAFSDRKIGWSKEVEPGIRFPRLDTRRKLNLLKKFRRHPDVLWTSYVRSIYVLCPGNRVLKMLPAD